MGDPKGSSAEWLTTRAYLLLLAAALLAAFPGVVLGFDTFFYRDAGALGYPGAIFTQDSLFHGELPLWNPYSHCGVPWLAQMGQWYPPSWISYLLPLPWSENFLMLAHLWFGGFGMFWLLKRWNVDAFAAAIGSFAFVFNGVSLSCLQWENYIASLAWLPWVVGGVMAAWRQGGTWLPAAAAASAMQVLTATPEITLLTWLLLGALWTSDVIARRARLFPSAGRSALVIGLAAGITMIQMLPFFDLLAHSQRSGGGAGTATWSMPGWGWANLLVPLFHGYPSPQGIWFQNGQDFLQSYYLGAGLLVLAIAGLWQKNFPMARIIALMTLFCWVMALGPNGYLYPILRKMIPLLGIARFPVKFTILTAFLVPMLAAFGAGTWRNAPAAGWRRLLLVGGGALILCMAALLWFAREFPFPADHWNQTAGNTFWRALLALALLGGIGCSAGIVRRPVRILLQLALLALLPLDALTHSPGIAPTLPHSILAPGMWQASGKGPPPALGDGRIMVSPDAEREMLYSPVTDLRADFIGKRLGEWYNLNLLDRTPKVNGAVTLRPAAFDALEHYLYYTPGGHCGRGLVDFLSVAWLSSPDNPTQWTKRTHFLPLITAGQQPVFADDATVFAALIANNFAPDKIVYLPEADRARVTATRSGDCAIKTSRFTLNTVDADLDASAPSVVVIAQAYYHRWHAYVDGTAVPLYRANLAFQAVEIPAGKHHLRLVYRDPLLEGGAILSALSLTACALLYLARRGRQGQRPPKSGF